MGECNPVISNSDEEENLIAAAQHLVKALESRKNLTDDARKVLADLGSQLSNISVANEMKDEGVSDIEERLNLVREKIMIWEDSQSMIWDCGPEASSSFLKAVDELQKYIEVLEDSWSAKDNEADLLLRRAHDVLQKAMTRLEEEFVHILAQNRQPFEPDHVSFRSSEEEVVVDEGSIASFGDESMEDMVQRDGNISRSSEEFVIDLVNPEVIPDLSCIANLMFNSDYGRECSQVFISVRKDALDDCLFILEVEKMSIEDVLKLEWNHLNSKIRRWVRALKIFVRVYLASEKWLSYQIFGDRDWVSSNCFTESSKASMMQLLNFGEAVALCPHLPEKLIRVLDMYEVLADLIPDIETLYYDENGDYVRRESKDVLKRLGDCATATFLEFENVVASSVSTNPFPGGGVHHLTRYVMNYMKTLTDYSGTLNLLLKDQEKEASSISKMGSFTEEEGAFWSVCPVALHFRSFISVLEGNLEEKSRLYKDDSLKHLFLMNNIHYIAEKVKGSELRKSVGDELIRKHNGKFQQHAMNYERATWSSILSSLKDEGIQNPGSNSISRTLLKERLQGFYLAFEDVYKSQTAWLIPDGQLRDDLRISTSLKVIQAYRAFVGRHVNHLSDRHIKYSADDMENLLLDFFEGSPKTLHSCHKK